MTPGKPLSILHRLNESALAGRVDRNVSNAVNVVGVIAGEGRTLGMLQLWHRVAHEGGWTAHELLGDNRRSGEAGSQ